MLKNPNKLQLIQDAKWVYKKLFKKHSKHFASNYTEYQKYGSHLLTHLGKNTIIYEDTKIKTTFVEKWQLQYILQIMNTRLQYELEKQFKKSQENYQMMFQKINKGQNISFQIQLDQPIFANRYLITNNFWEEGLKTKKVIIVYKYIKELEQYITWTMYPKLEN